MDIEIRLGDRVLERLNELGKTQQWLVDRVSSLFPGTDFDIGNAWAIINRKNRTSKYASQIAAALGVTHTWLTDGLPPKLVADAEAKHPQADQDIDGNVAGEIVPKSKRQMRIEEIAALADTIDDEGLVALVFMARKIAEECPLQIRQTQK